MTSYAGSAHAAAQAEERSAESPGSWRVWGLEPLRLHDLFWASHAVQVVRPGGEEPAQSGPQLYLLVGESDLALFPLREVVRRMNWLKPRLARLRITDAGHDTFREIVEADQNDGVLRVSRRYGERVHGAARVAVTPDPQVARAWWRASDDEAQRSLLKHPELQAASIEVKGRTLDARSQEDVRNLVLELQRTWDRVDAVIDQVFEFAPRVWVHESAQIERGATLVAPIWIGAGQDIAGDSLVIGPGAMPDGVGVDPPASVRWRDLHSSRWPRTWQRNRRRRRFTKRIFDLGFSAIVLLLTLPLYPLIIAAILVEDGWPAFFVHRRQTLRGREFGCIKFRTMRKDADRIKEQLAAANVCDGPQFFIQNDPRLLRVGGPLRKLQIDELPQFINVLLGHMSVVGPRPSPDRENQYCPAWREARLSVRPGITGLWQVRRTREPETDFQEWIRYDLEYVRRSSLKLDLWIIYQTVLRIIGR